MKPLSADGSVGFPHVRVGHCQASNKQPHPALRGGVFYWLPYDAAPMAQVIVTRILHGRKILTPSGQPSAVCAANAAFRHPESQRDQSVKCLRIWLDTCSLPKLSQHTLERNPVCMQPFRRSGQQGSSRPQNRRVTSATNQNRHSFTNWWTSTTRHFCSIRPRRGMPYLTMRNRSSPISSSAAARSTGFSGFAARPSSINPEIDQ